MAAGGAGTSAKPALIETCSPAGPELRIYEKSPKKFVTLCLADHISLVSVAIPFVGIMHLWDDQHI